MSGLAHITQKIVFFHKVGLVATQGQVKIHPPQDN